MSLAYGLALKSLKGEIVAAAEAAGSTAVAETFKNFTVGVVYTGYSPSSGIKYLQSVGMATRIAKTGTSHCHHESLHFDFGVYFESNGHGNVTFDRLKLDQIQKDFAGETDAALRKALDKFFLFLELVNDVSLWSDFQPPNLIL